MGKRKVLGEIKLEVPAGNANPAPPIGPALGQRGLNIMEFCKAFNADTQEYEKNTPLPVIITAYADRTFTYIIKTPPAAYLIKKHAEIAKGAQTTGKEKAGVITKAGIREIAELKFKDLNAWDIEEAMKSIEGTARSMGVEVAGG